MPSGDNWQGDVLRDLRSGAAAPDARPPSHGPAAPQPPHGPAAAQPPAQPSHGPAGAQPPHGPAGAQPPHGPAGAQPPHGPGFPARGAGGAVHGSAEPAPAAPAPAPGSAPVPAPAPLRGGRQSAQPPGGAPYPHPQPAPGRGHPEAAPQGHGPRHQPTGPPARTPDSRPAVDTDLAGAVRKPRHGEPFATRAARAVRRIVSSSVAREVAEATRAAELLQQPVTTGRQIAVTSIRGGAGKSTVAALLGTTYAHYRQDPVLFVEADPALGSLPVRLGAETLRWTTGDVADIVEPQMSLLDVTGYLVQLRDNAWLLPGSQGQIGAMLDTRSYERAMVALRRYFGVTVVDCETLPAEVARVALSASQARVLTTPATLDGVASTYAVLQWMRGLPPHMIAGTVVVLTEQTPHPGIDLAEAARTLRATGTSVHVLPYDRHLAAGGPIRPELLAHSTRQTATRLAADAFQLSQKRH
ncbi:MinD/ParA family ATP-binding protein [Streptomyces sp. H27-S2]|uniref:MinD/ParA family ATP-binding protein n=1 Tax=Streptomyces antarcticus TaxID=2996458 RepID=UPI00226F8AA6|nr:MinD/ParA family protein [Streptomyces sp. H27-S2]MCY0952736.1 MinD/ParA family protein [Streptomyces sp. H27-S2]